MKLNRGPLAEFEGIFSSYAASTRFRSGLQPDGKQGHDGLACHLVAGIGGFRGDPLVDPSDNKSTDLVADYPYAVRIADRPSVSTGQRVPEGMIAFTDLMEQSAAIGLDSVGK